MLGRTQGGSGDWSTSPRSTHLTGLRHASPSVSWTRDAIAMPALFVLQRITQGPRRPACRSRGMNRQRSSKVWRDLGV